MKVIRKIRYHLARKLIGNNYEAASLLLAQSLTSAEKMPNIGHELILDHNVFNQFANYKMIVKITHRTLEGNK